MSAEVVQVQNIKKVYSEWCVKAAEIILASRIAGDPGLTELPSQTPSFNLKVPELFNVRSEAVGAPDFFQLRTQRSFQVEVYMGALADEARDEDSGQLLERWTFSFFPAHPEPAIPDRCNQTLVRKLSVTLRSLLCFTRLLPAYPFCRNSRGTNNLHWRFRIEAWPPTSRAIPAQELLTQDFVSLQSSLGTLRLSVSQPKDLKLAQTSEPFKGTSTFGSQTEQIEMEESYFSHSNTPNPTDTAASLGRLDKITEEPEAKILDSRRSRPASKGPEQPFSSTTSSPAPHESSNAHDDRKAQPGPSSKDSNCSTMSTSSRGHSLPDHAVILGSTPPFASASLGSTPPSGLITLGPQLRNDSLPASRSKQSSPKLGPAPAPRQPPDSASEQRGRTPIPKPVAAAPPPVVVGNVVAASENRVSPPNANSEVATSSEHRASSPNANTNSNTEIDPPIRAGEFDDLSNIWMSCPPEWSRRRSFSGCSRSLSPDENTTRGSSPREPREREISPLREDLPEGEICMFGMSDDEEGEPPSDEDDDTLRNVVASMIQDGGGGGAFAGVALDAERLGFAGYDCPQDQEVPRQMPLINEGAGAPSKMLSPLIAQLNPFVQPETFKLPPSGSVGDTVAGNRGVDDATASNAVASANAAEAPEADEPLDVNDLLVEMGDLVCKLQQKQELAITSQEVSPEDLLANLTHFKEVAQGIGVDLDSDT